MVSDMFKSLGYPTHVIYPLAIAKILGITAILTKKSDLLKEWAYAGFFFELVLATMAHLNVADGGFGGALVALVLISISRFYDSRVFNSKSSDS
ncbi:MAG: hypothetical protein GY786_16270 [Proteobacteria bacterium]|nr:hypothetical protein [Pseudomonadota bacterium]